jgi:hypothetical protein
MTFVRYGIPAVLVVAGVVCLRPSPRRLSAPATAATELRGEPTVVQVRK